MYVDSNIFILAILDRNSKGDMARGFIRETRLNIKSAFTSPLTYDEVVWIIHKERGREFAIRAGTVFLSIKNLVFLDTTGDLVREAHELIQEYGLAPRDAIHAATAIRNEKKVILSEDKIFDKLVGLKRISLSQLHNI
jgi:predicted nucleic acid-binding protein